MNEAATSYGGALRPMRHCVGWGPSSPKMGTAAPPNFLPMFIVAKQSPISVTAELLFSFWRMGLWNNRQLHISSWVVLTQLHLLLVSNANDDSDLSMHGINFNNSGLQGSCVTETCNIECVYFSIFAHLCLWFYFVTFVILVFYIYMVSLWIWTLFSEFGYFSCQAWNLISDIHRVKWRA